MYILYIVFLFHLHPNSMYFFTQFYFRTFKYSFSKFTCLADAVCTIVPSPLNISSLPICNNILICYSLSVLSVFELHISESKKSSTFPNYHTPQSKWESYMLGRDQKFIFFFSCQAVFLYLKTQFNLLSSFLFFKQTIMLFSAWSYSKLNCYKYSHDGFLCRNVLILLDKYQQ